MYPNSYPSEAHDEDLVPGICCCEYKTREITHDRHQRFYQELIYSRSSLAGNSWQWSRRIKIDVNNQYTPIRSRSAGMVALYDAVAVVIVKMWRRCSGLRNHTSNRFSVSWSDSSTAMNRRHSFRSPKRVLFLRIDISVWMIWCKYLKHSETFHKNNIIHTRMRIAHSFHCFEKLSVCFPRMVVVFHPEF